MSIQTLYENAPVNFNAKNPTITEYQIVNIRIKIVNVTAVDNVNPCKFNKPVNVPSKTPIPPGTNDATPSIIDVAYVGITWINSIKSIPNA